MNTRRFVPVSVLAAVALFIGGCGRFVEDDATIVAPDQVQVAGQTTLASTTVATQVTYVVQPGESLSIIASRFGVDVRSLADFNAIADIDSVKAGQLLSIPPVQTTTTTTTTPAPVTASSQG